MWGPPDQIESHPTGGTYDRPQEEGGGTTTTYPWETWRYRYLEGVGREHRTGVRRSVLLRRLQDLDQLRTTRTRCCTLLAARPCTSRWAWATRPDRLNPLRCERQPESGIENSKEFDKLEMLAKVQAPPPVKFKDLEEVVSHKINVNLMPFEVRTDYVKVTGDTVLVPVTLQVKNKDITFVSKDGIQRGTVNIFGRVTGITGKVAQTFEDTVQVDVPHGAAGKDRGPFLAVLEGGSAASRPLSHRPGGEGRERRPRGHLEPRHPGSGVQRGQAGFVFADPGRPHGESADQECGLRQLRARRNQAGLSAPGWRGRQAGQLQARSADGAMDAGL